MAFPEWKSSRSWIDRRKGCHEYPDDMRITTFRTCRGRLDGSPGALLDRLQRRQGRVFLPFPIVRLSKNVSDLRPHRIEPQTEVHQHPGGNPRPLPQQPQQKMLSPDAVVFEVVGFFQRAT